MGKKWAISSLPCSLPAGINSNASRELTWHTRRSFLALCFPGPSPSCGGTPRSPFPSLHRLPPHPLYPRLDQEQYDTRAQHPAPAAPSVLSLTPIPKMGAISALAGGTQQSACQSASALGWICSTGVPEKIFVQHKVRRELTLKDFSRGITRERCNRKKPFVRFLLFVLLHIRQTQT